MPLLCRGAPGRLCPWTAGQADCKSQVHELGDEQQGFLEGVYTGFCLRSDGEEPGFLLHEPPASKG